MRFFPKTPQNTPSAPSTEAPSVSRRQFIQGAAAFAATAALSPQETAAREKHGKLLEIIAQLSPEQSRIAGVVRRIAEEKWADPTLKQRLLEPYDELDGQTIPEFAADFGLEPFWEVIHNKDKQVTLPYPKEALFVTGRLFPGLLIQESALDPEAFNRRSRAKGIAQITEIGKKDALKHDEAVFAQFAQAKGYDPRQTLIGSFEMARTHLQQNMIRYIQQDVAQLAKQLNLTPKQHGSLLGLLATNAYNAGHVPVRAMVRAYRKQPTPFSRYDLATKTATEIFTDMATYTYQQRHRITGAEAYGPEAASYVFLVLAATQVSDWARQQSEKMP